MDNYVDAKRAYEKGLEGTRSEVVILKDETCREVGSAVFSQVDYMNIRAEVSLFGHFFISEFSAIALQNKSNPPEKLAKALLKVAKKTIVTFDEIKQILIDSLKVFKCEIHALDVTNENSVLAVNLINTSPDLGEKLPELTYLDDPIEEEEESPEKLGNDGEENTELDSELKNDSFNSDEPREEFKSEADTDESEKSPEKSEDNDGNSKTSRRLKITKETRNLSWKSSFVIPRKSRLISSETASLSPIENEEKIFGQPRIKLGSKVFLVESSIGRRLELAEIFDEECPFKDLLLRVNQIKAGDFPLIQFFLSASEKFPQPVLLEYFLKRSTKEQLQNKIQHLIKKFASSLIYLREVAENQKDSKDLEGLLSVQDMKDAAQQVLAQKGTKGQVDWKDSVDLHACTLDGNKIITFSFRRALIDLPQIMITFHQSKIKQVFPVLTHDLIISARKVDSQITMFTKHFEEYLDNLDSTPITI